MIQPEEANNSECFRRRYHNRLKTTPMTPFIARYGRGIGVTKFLAHCFSETDSVLDYGLQPLGRRHLTKDVMYRLGFCFAELTRDGSLLFRLFSGHWNHQVAIVVWHDPIFVLLPDIITPREPDLSAIRWVDLCTPGMGVNLWGESPLYENLWYSS
jgi:hypothetical protein